MINIPESQNTEMPRETIWRNDIYYKKITNIETTPPAVVTFPQLGSWSTTASITNFKSQRRRCFRTRDGVEYYFYMRAGIRNTIYYRSTSNGVILGPETSILLTSDIPTTLTEEWEIGYLDPSLSSGLQEEVYVFYSSSANLAKYRRGTITGHLVSFGVETDLGATTGGNTIPRFVVAADKNQKSATVRLHVITHMKNSINVRVWIGHYFVAGGAKTTSQGVTTFGVSLATAEQICMALTHQGTSNSMLFAWIFPTGEMNTWLYNGSTWNSGGFTFTLVGSLALGFQMTASTWSGLPHVIATDPTGIRFTGMLVLLFDSAGSFQSIEGLGGGTGSTFIHKQPESTVQIGGSIYVYVIKNTTLTLYKGIFGFWTTVIPTLSFSPATGNISSAIDSYYPDVQVGMYNATVSGQVNIVTIRTS